MDCWTALSSGRGIVDDAERIASEATQPLCYVLSFDGGYYLLNFAIDIVSCVGVWS